MLFDLGLFETIVKDELGLNVTHAVAKKKFRPIVSYTTRPIRESETEGVEHLFITNEEADKLLEDQSNILAYTRIGENRYFTTVDQLQDYNVYVIDPLGIKDLREKHPEIKLKVIYISTDESHRVGRYLSRQGLEYNEENAKLFKERNVAEDEQFSEFENSKGFDVEFSNNNPYLVGTLAKIFEYIMEVYEDDILFCIVGRTASGKDTIVKYLGEIINTARDIYIGKSDKGHFHYES